MENDDGGRSAPNGSSAGGPSPERVAALRGALLSAYDVRKRDLPWRGETDPYRILVSEIMLQQTRVETVIPYYKKWVERFPDLEALAGAEEEEVLGVWEGLGYYSRARRLLGAARMIRERHGGELPTTAEALRSLPGVGDYTAGAVASIAFGEPTPAVDGNVRRVLSRLLDLPDPPPRELRALAGSLVDPLRPGDFNQALMELGATVCLPRSPRCSCCPVGDLCQARERATVEARPRRSRTRPVPEVTLAVCVAVRRAGAAAPVGSGGKAGAIEILMRKRPDAGLLAGLWELPAEELGPSSDGEEAGSRILRELGQRSSCAPQPLPEVQHVFSHLKARYRPLLFRVQGNVGAEGGCWYRVEEIGRLPVPVAQRKMLASALEALGIAPG